MSGRHTHMTNSLNTPVEALEHALPLRVRSYSLRRDSGGSGLHRGGDGLVRELELLAPAEVSLLSSRRDQGPWGLDGGGPGRPGANTIVRADGRIERLDGCARARLGPADVLRIETPGGGGWGEA